MRPRERQFDTEYSSIFDDASVVAAYDTRPPYADEMYEILLGLMDPAAPYRAVLDAGCGPGTIARRLADGVDRVDAVDIAPRMIDEGRRSPGGDNPRIRWIAASMEDAPLDPPYALVVAAASLHWMHWETVMPRFAEVLTPGGMLAGAGDNGGWVPWQDGLGFIGDYSMNKDFRPYSIWDELERRGLFRPLGRADTKPVVFSQSLDDYVESFHARNGLSRDRMDPALAKEFDDRVRALVAEYRTDGTVELTLTGTVTWGRPL